MTLFDEMCRAIDDGRTEPHILSRVAHAKLCGFVQEDLTEAAHRMWKNCGRRVVRKPPVDDERALFIDDIVRAYEEL